MIMSQIISYVITILFDANFFRRYIEMLNAVLLSEQFKNVLLLHYCFGNSILIVDVGNGQTYLFIPLTHA